MGWFSRWVAILLLVSSAFGLPLVVYTARDRWGGLAFEASVWHG